MRRLLLLSALLVGCGSSAGEGPGTDPDRAEETARSAASSPSLLPAVVRPGPGETLGARVRSPIRLRASPSPSSPVVARVGRRTNFGGRSVMAVLEQRGRWIGVHWPGLENGELGWVRQDDVQILRELWRIDLDLSERRATLLRRGRPYRSFAVAVGAPGTETPTGRFGVTDRLTTGGPGSTYGCCVLALSGRQPDVPQEWPGGDRLAIHGTNRPESIGRAATLGCPRASARAMRMLMAKVPLGTQVRIRR